MISLISFQLADFGFFQQFFFPIKQIGEYHIFNNNLRQIGLALVFLSVFLLFFKILQSVIIKYLEGLSKKTKTDIDDTFIKIVKSLKPPFYFFLSFYLAIKFLHLPELAQRIVNIILIAWVIIQAIIAVHILINYIVEKWAGKKDKSTKAAIKLISRLVKYLLWVIGALLVLDNLGVDVTSLIAGLGVGGIAIALALQNVLGDLFSSLAIYFDKPFKVGDFIVIGKYKGTVKHIGIKTTRIKSLDGEEIVVPNKKLTSAELRNFKKLKKRRVSFTIGVVYETGNTKLRKIPKLIKKAIESTKDVSFSRAHFYEMADFSLNFAVVYYVDSKKYKKYMNVHQQILFKIKLALEKEKIAIAYPTQTLFVQKKIEK